MHPTLFEIPLPGWTMAVRVYGALLCLSVLVGYRLTLDLARKDGIPERAASTSVIASLIAGVLGARLAYVLGNASEFRSAAAVLAFGRGGLSLYGGLLGGFVGLWASLRREPGALLKFADAAAPSLALGIFLSRLGCYCFGCDFGKPLSSAAPRWLIALGTFPRWSERDFSGLAGSPAWVQHVSDGRIGPDALVSLPVHPTQLYEAGLGLALLGLSFMERQRRRFFGHAFLVLTFAYGAGRYLLDFARDDHERALLGPSHAAYVYWSAGLFFLSLVFVLGPGRLIERRAYRDGSRALALLLPAASLLFARRLGLGRVPVQLSLSQWLALATAAAAALVATRARVAADARRFSASNASSPDGG